VISAEALALFVELEGVPPRELERALYREKSKRLAGLLGLSMAWWRGQTVSDRSAKPAHGEGMCAHDDWHECRRLRELLLEMVTASHS